MASDWAAMRALAAVDVLGPKPGEDWSETVKKIAAALDEARAEGRKEALGDAVPLKDLMAEALEEARREGAERERKQSGVERAWLIESRFTPAPTWWTGTDHPAPWTRDSLKAVRFCRKCDAEAAMAALQDGHFCFASEHQWGLGPMRGPEEEA